MAEMPIARDRRSCGWWGLFLHRPSHRAWVLAIGIMRQALRRSLMHEPADFSVLRHGACASPQTAFEE
jgi:hypothetical protein